MDYYSLLSFLTIFFLLPWTIVTSWKNYYEKKQREKTLRTAIKYGGDKEQ